MLYKHFCLPYCTNISIYFVVHTFLFTMLSAFSGEGIHHAMEGGKLVAMFLDEVITQGNYDTEVMAIYHQRWMDQFGFDFKW